MLLENKFDVLTWPGTQNSLMVVLNRRLPGMACGLHDIVIQAELREDDGSLYVWVGEDKETSPPLLLPSLAYAVTGGRLAKSLICSVSEAEEAMALAMAKCLSKHLNRPILLSCHPNILRALTEDAVPLKYIIDGVRGLME